MVFFHLFIFGLVIGSFLNCVIYRLALPNFSLKNLGGLKNRSYCPHCKHSLNWKDLIPIFSFLILRGKCRYCKKKISWQYSLVELATGLLFVLILWHSIYDLRFMIYELIISSFLIIIFVYDLKHFIIPDRIIYPAIFIVLGFRAWDLIGHWALGFGIFNPFISAFAASAFFLLIVLVSRGKWMGVGDIKLAFFMGLFLGFPNILVALFFAFLIGGIIGVGLILAKIKTLKSEVPFGPFLVTATFIALFWGEKIIFWYLTLIGF